MDGWFHGTLHGYQRMQCRCDECKRAKREYMQVWRAQNRERVNAKQREARASDPARFRAYGSKWREQTKERLPDDQRKRRARAKAKMGTADFPHGATGYLLGCKCDTCRVARAEYVASWRASKTSDDIPHATSNGYDNYGCRCDECHAAHAARSSKSRRRVNSKTLEHATRHGDQWTGADLEIITTRTDLSLVELAALLGRSRSAVASARRRALAEPKYQRIIGTQDGPL